ncbi:manganese superoxide dismutase [Apiospora marii]|uniref:mitochondrial 37S ribosomal protein mS42 n=1 Tax=Apiospora marii TaxID=335849 RepID=UPI003131E00B
MSCLPCPNRISTWLLVQFRSDHGTANHTPSPRGGASPLLLVAAALPVLLGTVFLVRPDTLTFFSPNNAAPGFPPATAGPHALPALPYAYDALEPYFDKETMEIHHARHHQTYVNNLNAALAQLSSSQSEDKTVGAAELSTLSADELVQNLDKVPAGPERTALRNSAGGHVNHSHFWRGLKKGTSLPAEGSPLQTALEASFGDLATFRAQFEKAAATVFGSGWAWLVLSNPEEGAQQRQLKIVTTANQDSPLMGADVCPGGCGSGTPILGLDVWEHAYYLKYQNRRPDYIKAFWEVVNWEEASRLYDAAIAN